MSTYNKRDMDASEDDDEFEENYKDGLSLHDALDRDTSSKVCWEWRNYKKAEDGVEIVKISCKANKTSDKDWLQLGGKEANFADSVSSFVKEYLFPRFKFLKNEWMKYDKGQDSFSTYVQGKVQILEGAEYKDQWERVICPTIQAKYVTIRCNLNNEIQRTYKSKFIQMRTMFFQHY
jgi:hypothetical protein